MNKVFLIGNLTRDPERSETPNGNTVCRFSIAVTRTYANSEGTRDADYFNITVWRGRAENCYRYLKKGNKVAVSGSLQTRSYKDKDGNTRNVTDIVAEDVEFLTPRSAGEEPRTFGDDVQVGAKTRQDLESLDDDDNLPF